MDEFDIIIKNNRSSSIDLIEINFPKFGNKKFIKEIYDKLDFYKKNNDINKKNKNFKIHILFASIHKNIIELCSLFLFVHNFYNKYENVENIDVLFSYFTMIILKSRSICNVLDIQNEKLNEYKCDELNSFVEFGKKYYDNIHNYLSKIKSEYIYTSNLYKILNDENIELFSSSKKIIF